MEMDGRIFQNKPKAVKSLTRWDDQRRILHQHEKLARIARRKCETRRVSGAKDAALSCKFEIRCGVENVTHCQMQARHLSFGLSSVKRASFAFCWEAQLGLAMASRGRSQCKTCGLRSCFWFGVHVSLRRACGSFAAQNLEMPLHPLVRWRWSDHLESRQLVHEHGSLGSRGASRTCHAQVGPIQYTSQHPTSNGNCSVRGAVGDTQRGITAVCDVGQKSFGNLRLSVAVKPNPLWQGHEDR